MTELSFASALKRSGVETPCKACQGWGRRWYSHGSTWRGGVGTCSFEQDVCDICWGSGDAGKPFEDRRKLEESCRERLRTATLYDWLRRDFAPVGSLDDEARWMLGELLAFLGKLERRRKPAPTFWQVQHIDMMMGALRRLIGDEK